MSADVPIGSTILHYRIMARLGSGGMGVVYLAEDLRLKRRVALKFLSVPGDGAAEARLVREAQTASALDHPNVATIHEVGDWNDRPFIVMGYYPGETLRARLARGPLPLPDILDIAAQIAAGLAAAHAVGIVHRDLKPANVMVSPSGQVRILDFGLARSVSGDDETMTRLTREGVAVGTVAYMSPEQARGVPVDRRSDVWSFGVLLYEMLAGRTPFDGRTTAALLLAVVSGEPAPVSTLRPDTPPEVDRLCGEALAKDPASRAITADRIHEELQACRARLSGAALIAPRTRPSRRVAVAAAVVVVLLVVGAGGAWRAGRWMDARWATREAAPQAARLADEGRFVEALSIVREASRHAPDDAALSTLLGSVSRAVTIETTPAGARVAYAAYGAAPAWQFGGDTPAREAVVPRGLLRWRIERDGFALFEDAMLWEPRIDVRLIPSTEAPAGMVRATGSRTPRGTVVNGRLLAGVTFGDFWIDRYEVTNREFLAFVSAGGYRTRTLWRHPFERDGHSVSWEDGVRDFRDQTGLPGPATWALGRYPEGDADKPVTGVSWFEAAAYAAFAGKDLPTIYHWNHVAAHEELRAQVIPLANFEGRLALPVGRTGALHRFGAYDLAGNVKEWVANESVPGARYILGGAWNEPAYMFVTADARSAWERQANFGFRCVRYDADRSFLPGLSGPIPPPVRDYSVEQPVRDEVFRAYTRLYAYDRTPLDARVESIDASPLEWTRETVSFRAAYGTERVLAHVFLPKRGRAPYQIAVFVPGAGALDVPSSAEEAERPFAGFLASSGRALVVPIVRGTYERSSPALRGDTPRESNAFRDSVIDWSKDLGRTLDYLATRADVAADKVAYVGISRGAAVAPVLLALEPRVKAAVLYIPGFYAHRLAPEVDVINFAPRVSMPVLVLNGKYDFVLPERSSQEPFFRALGTPTAHKRRIVYDTGHDLPRNAMIRETLLWLDRYLGPVG